MEKKRTWSDFPAPSYDHFIWRNIVFESGRQISVWLVSQLQTHIKRHRESVYFRDRDRGLETDDFIVSITRGCGTLSRGSRP